VVDTDLLRDVLEYRLSTPESIKKYLKTLRAGSPFTRYNTYKEPFKRRLRVIFIALHCIEELRDEELKREVVAHMQAITIALSRTTQIYKVNLKGLPSGWRFSFEGEDTTEHSLSDLDYRKFKIVKSPEDMHKCGM
jgi:hypothetical protein